ncbi:MAG: CBS domain-containing protein, partial [bacterium]
IVIAGLFYVIRIAFPWNVPTGAVLGYLVWINGLLAGINHLPAFPLDGGRLFRSVLWAWKKDLQTATRIASSFGTGFAFLLMVLGVVWFFMGSLIGGIWWVLIGLFLYRASQMSYKQLIVREALEGETVERFMKKDHITVPPGTSILSFVEDYVYSHHFKLFPVMESDRLVGCVTTRDVKNVPREKWNSTTVGDIARECNGSNSVAPDTGVMEALTLMNRERIGRLVVVDHDRLAGVITIRDLGEYLSLKLDLESQVGSRRGAA